MSVVKYGYIKMKIDIEIEDYRKFASVAFLVDRDDFLKDVEAVRKRIKLTKLPYTFPIYPYKEANRLVGFYKSGQISLNGTRELLEEFCKEEGLQNLYALDKTLGTAVLLAESLTKKYNKNRLYIPAILASILIAYIKEEDFLSTQMYQVNRRALQEEFSPLEEGEEIITIRVNRESTSKEVERVFDFIQKYYFKTKKTKDGDGLKSIYQHVYDDKPPAKAANEIRRDRDWHWLKKEGWSYQQIRKNYTEKTRHRITLRGVELGIKRYDKHLK